FAQIGTSPTADFSDTGLAGTTSYTYRVRAADAANNVSAYSNETTATTLVAPDTQAPTAAADRGTTAVSNSGIDLGWTASTDNVGVATYLIERCQDAGCDVFVQIGTSTGASFSDTGLSTATSYSYRVRAADAADNRSDYANTATATTSAAVAT